MPVAIFPKSGFGKLPYGVQINRSHPLSNGLVLSWLMNEGGGSNLYDGYANVVGAISGATWKPDVSGPYLSFNGSSDYVEFNGIPTRDTGTPFAGRSFSLCAWMRPTTLPQGEAIAVKNGNLDGFGFGVGDGAGGSGSKLQGLWGGSSRIDSGYTFPDTTSWHHVVANFDASAFVTTFYVDGAVQPGTGIYGFVPTGTFDLGRENSLGRYYAGDLSGVLVYDGRFLTPSEIWSLYAAQRNASFLMPQSPVRRYWSVTSPDTSALAVHFPKTSRPRPFAPGLAR